MMWLWACDQPAGGVTRIVKNSTLCHIYLTQICYFNISCYIKRTKSGRWVESSDQVIHRTARMWFSLAIVIT